MANIAAATADYCTTVLGSIEHFHVDFKTKNRPAQSSLSEPDKKNLAKAISGFANSGGGVLIWGIEDKTLLPKPIINVHQFMSLLLNLAAQTRIPSHQELMPIGSQQTPGVEAMDLVYFTFQKVNSPLTG